MVWVKRVLDIRSIYESVQPAQTEIVNIPVFLLY